jgi:helix-turn-helix protein
MAGRERSEKVVKLNPRPRFSRVAPAVAKATIRRETERVVIALGLHADANGQCWPKNELLSEESGVDITHLPRALRQAREEGLLQIEPGRAPHGGNLFTLIGLAPIQVGDDLVEPRSMDVATGGYATEPRVASVATGGYTAEPQVAINVATGGYTAEPQVAIDVATGGYRPYIEEHPSEHPNGASHSTARGRARESAVEILSPIEVERADQFELLWVEYPSRPDDSKRSARQVFDELVSAGVHADHLIAAAIRYAEWVRRDEPGGAYVPHLHRWLREGRYQHDGKSWPRPRQSVVGIARDMLENFPPLATEREDQASPPRGSRIYWTDRLDELERTASWSADWGPPPDDPACQLPPRFRNKPCVRRWREHKSNLGQ